jgi:hypothetical protein
VNAERGTWLVILTEEDSDQTWTYELEGLEHSKRVLAHMAWVYHHQLGRPGAELLSAVVVAVDPQTN